MEEQPLQTESMDLYQAHHEEEPDVRLPGSRPSSLLSWTASENSSTSARRSARTSLTERALKEQDEEQSIARKDSNRSSQRTLIGENIARPRTPRMKDETTNQAPPTPGQRRQPELPRGIYSRPGSLTEEQVGDAIEELIVYQFENRDLLLEALESPKSGITCVGQGNRPIPDGNKALANLGKAVMNLALMEQLYEYQIPESEHPRMFKLFERDNLASVGNHSGFQKWIRPRKPLPPSQQRNVMLMIKDDLRALTGEKDPKRVIARAMRALIGAVYLDGGREAAVDVMRELRLLISTSPLVGPHDE